LSKFDDITVSDKLLSFQKIPNNDLRLASSNGKRFLDTVKYIVAEKEHIAMKHLLINKNITNYEAFLMGKEIINEVLSDIESELVSRYRK